MRQLRLFSLLALISAAFAQQGNMHVVELHHKQGVDAAEVLAVFAGLGVAKDQAAPLLQKVSAAGKAVVVAGAQEQCEAVAAKFGALGMETTVRALTKADMPSEYGNSDVIEADTATLRELMDSSEGAMVTFYAPWCGHCKQMVPDFKKAAAQLKPRGIRVAAVNSDNEPGLAQSLGIRGFPAIKWVAGGKAVDYKGPRQTLEMVQFAQQQSVLTRLKSKVGEVAQGVRAAGKLAMSKVLGRGGGGAPAAAAAA